MVEVFRNAVVGFLNDEKGYLVRPWRFFIRIRKDDLFDFMVEISGHSHSFSM